MKRVLCFFTAALFALILAGCEAADNSTTDNGGTASVESPEITDPINIPDAANRAEWAGFRSSPYGFGDGGFPSKQSWKLYVDKMKSFYKKNATENSNGTLVWIVGVVTNEPDMPGISCYVNFPKPKEISVPKGLAFSDTDENEKYFKAFDDAGYKVWLQVESGNVDIVELAKVVMNQYKGHKCIRGFGIDVEWYKNVTDGEPGTPIDDETAALVDAEVKKANKGYSVFVKHWREDYLPSEYRGTDNDMIFVTDSQGFKNLDSAVKYYREWAEDYAPNPVFFQIGYYARSRNQEDVEGSGRDEKIWKAFDKPLQDFGQAILDGMLESSVKAVKTQKKGIIWVDFTLKDAYNLSK